MVSRELLMTTHTDSYLAAQHWTLTCWPWPAGWEWTCVCLPAERRKTVSYQSGRWISSLQLSVSTGQQTAVPPCNRQVHDQQATKPASLLYTFQKLLHSLEFGPWVVWGRSGGINLLQCVFFLNVKLHLIKGMSTGRNKKMLVTRQSKWGAP